jgi:hypothetical protein
MSAAMAELMARLDKTPAATVFRRLRVEIMKVLRG